MRAIVVPCQSALTLTGINAGFLGRPRAKSKRYQPAVIRRRGRCFSGLVIAVCLAGQAAWAHAFLDRASPAVGSEVSGSPPSLTLTYTEPVEPLFSTVQVTDAAGVRVKVGKPVAQKDGRILIVKLSTLPPGVYAVAWHVTSVDTHKTEGHFSFTVKP